MISLAHSHQHSIEIFFFFFQLSCYIIDKEKLSYLSILFFFCFIYLDWMIKQMTPKRNFQ
uniref:Uncharacterized protein n=1 Tax=Rhizophora mucronata TaxID=61149 RepID=A0A2P2J6K8_RHIMU